MSEKPEITLELLPGRVVVCWAFKGFTHREELKAFEQRAWRAYDRTQEPREKQPTPPQRTTYQPTDSGGGFAIGLTTGIIAGSVLGSDGTGD